MKVNPFDVGSMVGENLKINSITLDRFYAKKGLSLLYYIFLFVSSIVMIDGLFSFPRTRKKFYVHFKINIFVTLMTVHLGLVWSANNRYKFLQFGVGSFNGSY